MIEPLRKGDVKTAVREELQEVVKEQRKTNIRITDLTKKVNTSTSEIIGVIFSESRTLREEIGRQTIILKMLEDNLSEIQFGEDTGVSSRIELSVGGQIFGTGAKWILDIDTSKASYSGLLEAIQLVRGIPPKIKEWAKSRIKKKKVISVTP